MSCVGGVGFQERLFPRTLPERRPRRIQYRPDNKASYAPQRKCALNATPAADVFNFTKARALMQLGSAKAKQRSRHRATFRPPFLYRWMNGYFRSAPINFFDTRGERIVGFATQQKTPAVYQFRQYAVWGGLMSYGINLPEGYRQVGIYAVEALKGANPGDLPIVQSIKFEFVINLKAEGTRPLRCFSSGPTR